MGRRRPFYGWLMVVAGMLTIGTAMGIMANSFSLFIVPVSAELGFSRSEMSFNQTIFSLGLMVVALLWGPVFTKLRLKRMMVLAAAVSAVGYFLYSVAKPLWAFYAISAVLSLAMGLLGWMPFTVIIGNWFNRKRGLAIGLTFMGSGIGGMIFNALGGALIAHHGWRTTIVALSLVLLLVTLPVVLFVIKVKPTDAGRLPYGGDEGPDLAAEAEVAGLTMRDALRGSRFYLIALSVFALGISMNSLNTTITPHMQSLGYSPVFSANVGAAYMASLALGKFSLGFLSDRLGTRRACTLSLIALATALLSLIFSKFFPVVALLVLTSGFGNSFGTVAYPLITREVYGERDYAAITGILSAVGSFGSAIGPAVSGAIFDASGSYSPGYAGMIAIVAAFGGVLIFSMRRSARTILY